MISHKYRPLFPDDCSGSGCFHRLVAILFTGKYPKGMYEFSVGVQRWQTW